MLPLENIALVILVFYWCIIYLSCMLGFINTFHNAHMSLIKQRDTCIMGFPQISVTASKNHVKQKKNLSIEIVMGIYLDI